MHVCGKYCLKDRAGRVTALAYATVRTHTHTHTWAVLSPSFILFTAVTHAHTRTHAPTFTPDLIFLHPPAPPRWIKYRHSRTTKRKHNSRLDISMHNIFHNKNKASSCTDSQKLLLTHMYPNHIQDWTSIRYTVI